MITDFRFYMKLLVRRLPWMLALLLLASAIGFAMAIRMPNVYQTQATLVVESAQIPDNLARSSIPEEAIQQLALIQQRLLTRANLIDVARENNVFTATPGMTPDEIVQEMRERTDVRRASGRNRATLMTISFVHENPRTVAAVVNQYVTIVLASNADFREDRTQGALDFFEQEVRTLSENLDRQNQSIVEFKRLNAQALPDNLNFRLNRQTLLQERISRSERDLEILKQQIASVEQIYAQNGQVPVSAGRVATPEESRLRRLEAELSAALSIYSPENPKVQLLQKQIDTARAQVASLAAANLPPEDAQSVSPLEVSLAEFTTRQSALEEEIRVSQIELAELQDSIDRTPANGIALAALERERNNFQGLYTAAVDRLSAAELGIRIEASAKGERITELEPANVPTTPFGPNRKKIAAIGVGAGLALAVGLFLLLEFLNSSVRRPADVVSGLGITPLSTIPRIETAAHRRWRRAAQVAALIVTVLGVPTILWAIDTYYLPLDLIFEKIADRLI